METSQAERLREDLLEEVAAHALWWMESAEDLTDVRIPLGSLVDSPDPDSERTFRDVLSDLARVNAALNI